MSTSLELWPMGRSLSVAPVNLPNGDCEIWPIVSANRLHWITGQVVLLLFLLEKRVRASKPNAEPNRLVRR